MTTTATTPAEATSAVGSAPAAFQFLPLDRLFESPLNPRTHFDQHKLAELADSIRANGILTPLLARSFPKGGHYEIAAGHRRFRAAKLAGLDQAPVIVRPMTDLQLLEVLTIENLQRDDLNALEEAQGFVSLIKEAGYDVPKIAERVGRSVKYVYDRIKLLQMIPEAKKLVLDGTLTPGHGILLARLTKEDQQRALAADDPWRGGGALETEHIDESYFAHGGEPLPDSEDGPKKARSVRELAQWIDRNVRFHPDQVDQTDLAFDLPETATLLETAAATKLKVVKITREYRVPDEARDEKERTIGHDHWKRADGEPEVGGPWAGPEDGKPSKTCDHSVVGLVVAGPGRGEAFLVCVNKEKCSVHWAQAMKERAQRAKEREQSAASRPAEDGQAPTPKKADPTVLPDELREKWEQEEITARLPAIVKAVKAVIPELKISDEICWNLATNGELFFDGWQKVGKRGYYGAGGLSDYLDALEPLVAAELPGRFEKGRLRATDGPGARSELAWLIWQARDAGDLDQAIDKAVATRWTAELKARAKPAQTSAKRGPGRPKGSKTKKKR